MLHLNILEDKLNVSRGFQVHTCMKANLIAGPGLFTDLTKHDFTKSTRSYGTESTMRI